MLRLSVDVVWSVVRISLLSLCRVSSRKSLYSPFVFFLPMMNDGLRKWECRAACSRNGVRSMSMQQRSDLGNVSVVSEYETSTSRAGARHTSLRLGA